MPMTTPELTSQHAAVRAAVLDGLPDEPLVSHASLGRIRGELRKRVEPFATGLAEGVEVHVDRYSLRAALVCPASAERGEFEWTAPTAARSVALPAVSSLARGGDHDPLEAVNRSIAEAIDEQRSVGQWLGELDGIGRATTVAAAVTWCARAMVAVPWQSFDNLRFGFDAVWHRPLGFGSAIVMRGRPDASVLLRRGRMTETVLLDLGAADPVVAGLDALMASLKVGRAPLRIVFVRAASGRVDAIDVDVDLLDAAVDHLVSAVESLVAPAQGLPAAERPGRQCWSCDRRDRCATGMPWMAAQPRRVAGIPVP